MRLRAQDLGLTVFGRPLLLYGWACLFLITALALSGSVPSCLCRVCWRLVGVVIARGYDEFLLFVCVGVERAERGAIIPFTITAR